jgi:hypothetical protein
VYVSTGCTDVVKGDVPDLGLTYEDVGLLRGWIMASQLKA